MIHFASYGGALRLSSTITALFLCSVHALAEDLSLNCHGEPKQLTAMETDLRSLPTATPVPVTVGLFVEDLRDIDAVTDSFRFRGVIRVSWCDPRQAFDPEIEGSEEKVFFGAEALAVQTDAMWTARGFPVNQVDSFDITERVVRIRHDGHVSGDLNVSIRLSAQFDLRRFPFDTQLLRFYIESFTWNANQVVFVADDSTTGFADDFKMPEWTITDVRAHVDEVDVTRSAQPFSRLVLTMEINRQSGFYVWKVMLPLLIIVALSWSVFWMSDEKFGIRVRTTATGILTIVAYQFVAGQALPRLGYLTLMDKFMVGSFVLLGVTVLESYIASRFPEDQHHKAMSVDRAARWMFPLAYFSMISMISLTA
jgi:hypothetical protein